MFYGQTWIKGVGQVWYAAYAVAGLKGSNDFDWMAMRGTAYNDNNKKPAYGGRVALNYSGDVGAVIGDMSVGASYTGGRYDAKGELQYDIAGADVAIQLWKATLRGEYAFRRTMLDPNASGYPYVMVDDWFDKSGWYAELEHPLGKYVSMVYRYDQLERKGVPLPGSNPGMTPDSKIERGTVGTVITPASGVYIKLSYEYWKPSDFTTFQSGHVGLGGAF
jgi:hypothetical protein